MSDGVWIQPSAHPPDDSDDEECFAYDLFLACVSGLVGAGHENPGTIYERSRAIAQRLYELASEDREFHEVMDQTWPTKFS